jgi:hypothetical protein
MFHKGNDGLLLGIVLERAYIPRCAFYSVISLKWFVFGLLAFFVFQVWLL